MSDKNEQSKHTQGQWEVAIESTCSGAWLVIRKASDPEFEICQTECFAINTTNEAVTYAEKPAVWKDKEEADEIRANARLISAAPEVLADHDALKAENTELHELLRQALPIVEAAKFPGIAMSDPWTPNQTLISKIRAAITKAEGTNP